MAGATERIEGRSATHPDFPGMSIAEALEHELPHLMPMTAPFDGYIESPARVSSTCLVSARAQSLPVPCAYAGHRVRVRLYPERIVIVGDQEIIAEHPRATERDHVVYDWQHYVPLIARKPARCATARRLPTCRSRSSGSAVRCCVAQAVIG